MADDDLALSPESVGRDTEVVVLPQASRNGEDALINHPVPAPKREMSSEKSRPQVETAIVEPPIPQRVDNSERRERTTNVTAASDAAAPENRPRPKTAATSFDKPAPRDEFKNESFAPSPSAASFNERPNGERKNYDDRDDYFTSSPITSGAEANGAMARNERFERAAPPTRRAGVANKIFAEQSQMHLQVIRESLGRLYTDPTRQETLQRIKHAAIGINNLAKRFVFDVVATYAATIEEICERVLDGEINMSKKLINAFTEIPGIFDGLVNDDEDALLEARRHQERLQRLADSFIDGEVVNVDLHNRPSVPAPPVRPPLPRAPLSPRAALKAAAQLEHQPRPATEVMEYLDDYLVNRKKNIRP